MNKSKFKRVRCILFHNSREVIFRELVPFVEISRFKICGLQHVTVPLQTEEDVLKRRTEILNTPLP